MSVTAPRIDSIKVADVTRYERGLISELESNGAEVLRTIREEQELSKGTEEKLRGLLDRYTQAFA